MVRFIGILQFLTRITLSKDLPYDEHFKRGIIYFPLVGLVLGGINLLAYRFLIIFFNHSLALLIVLSLYIMLTGGLHLDGLGDTFDGFYSNRPREVILEIMKDSRLGTNGVLAIVMVLMLKIAALFSLNTAQIPWVLLYFPIMGRLALVFGSYNVAYARKEGLGNVFIGKVSPKELLIPGFITIGLTAIDWKNSLFILMLFGFSFLYKRHSNKIIGGMTGDTLGALCELSEVLYLLFWSIII